MPNASQSATQAMPNASQSATQAMPNGFPGRGWGVYHDVSTIFAPKHPFLKKNCFKNGTVWVEKLSFLDPFKKIKPEL